MRSIILLLGIAVSACQSLPEEGSPAAELYRARCDGCHRAYAPSLMRFATWEMILPRMEERIAQAKQPPLSAQERETIREYLRRHASLAESSPWLDRDQRERSVAQTPGPSPGAAAPTESH